MKIAVGLSGGIDSAVACAILKNEGHDVTAVMMTLWDGEYRKTGKHACFGPDEQEEVDKAAEIAEFIGVPFVTLDCSKEYKSSILEYVKREYRSGRTPNPCVKCNHEMKFGLLPELVRSRGLDFDRFATGHYVRTEYDPATGRYSLLRGKDPKKDQSYFLYRLSQRQLSESMFPLGMTTKIKVRALAAELGLPVADIPESQDFYSGDMADIIGEEPSGDIVDKTGRVLGRHRGISKFTIGQRKGLGISSCEPLYVTGIDSQENRIIVGSSEEAVKSQFTTYDTVFSSVENISGYINVSAKIRSAGNEYPAVISLTEVPGVLNVSAESGLFAVTPGQSAVFYKDDKVLCGGVINPA